MLTRTDRGSVLRNTRDRVQWHAPYESSYSNTPPFLSSIFSIVLHHVFVCKVNRCIYMLSDILDSEQPESTAAPTPTTTSGAAPTTSPSIEESLELAKRAFALKKYEQAVEHYATALELMYVSRPTSRLFSFVY